MTERKCSQRTLGTPERGKIRRIPTSILGVGLIVSVIASGCTVLSLLSDPGAASPAVPTPVGTEAGNPLAAPTSGLAVSGAFQDTSYLHQASISNLSLPEWVNISAGLSAGPPPRANASVAWDAADGYYVLFGGERNGTIFGDTWKFQDGNWSQIHSTSSPVPRYGASMTFDSKEGAIVLFGGGNASGTLNDTWLFSGGKWTGPLPSKGSPRGRLFASMAYDANLSAVIMLGGLLPSNQSAETWEFSGDQWTPANPGGRGEPADRVGAMLVYDPGPMAPGLVLFGGWDPASTKGPLGLNDTWRFVANSSGTGGSWQSDNATTHPSARYDAAAAYDAIDNAIILYGGENVSGKVYSDTWEWTTGNWTNISGSLTTQPGPRVGAAMAQSTTPGTGPSDTLRVPLLFGGWSPSAGVSGGTWFFGSLPLSILPPRPSASALDEGTSGSITVMAFGGNATFYSYNWSGLPNPCVSADLSTITCTPSVDGVFGVSAEVTDASHSQRQSNMVNWTVNTPPKIGDFLVSPSPVVEGTTLAVTVGVIGGTPPYTYKYSGFPIGCEVVDAAQFQCTPASTGPFNLTVQVTDADGLRTSNVTTPLIVNPPAKASSAAWEYIVEGAIVLVIVVVGVMVVRRKVGHRPSAGPPPTNPPTDRSSVPPLSPSSIPTEGRERTSDETGPGQ